MGVKAIGGALWKTANTAEGGPSTSEIRHEPPEALLFKSPKPEASKMSLDGKFPDQKNYTFKTISWRVRLTGFVYGGEAKFIKTFTNQIFPQTKQMRTNLSSD